MILRDSELEASVVSDVYASSFVPLQPRSIYNYRGEIRVTYDGNDYGAQAEVDQYQDEWRLSQGTYVVEFGQEIINGYPEYLPFIFPSSNAMEVGVISQQRLVSDNDLWTLLHVNKSANIENDAVVGILVMFESGRNRYDDLGVDDLPPEVQTEQAVSGSRVADT